MAAAASAGHCGIRGGVGGASAGVVRQKPVGGQGVSALRGEGRGRPEGRGGSTGSVAATAETPEAHCHHEAFRPASRVARPTSGSRGRHATAGAVGHDLRSLGGPTGTGPVELLRTPPPPAVGAPLFSTAWRRWERIWGRPKEGQTRCVPRVSLGRRTDARRAGIAGGKGGRPTWEFDGATWGGGGGRRVNVWRRALAPSWWLWMDTKWEASRGAGPGTKARTVTSLARPCHDCGRGRQGGPSLLFLYQPHAHGARVTHWRRCPHLELAARRVASPFMARRVRGAAG